MNAKSVCLLPRTTAFATLISAAALLAGCAPHSNLPLAPRNRMSAQPAAPASVDRIEDYAGRQLVVQLAQGQSVDSICHEYGTYAISTLPDGYVSLVSVPPAQDLDSTQSRMSEDPRIVVVEKNFFLDAPECQQASAAFNEGFLDSSDFWDQTVATRLHLDEAHRIAQGRGILVAVLDTGIDPTHPLLAGRIAPGGINYVEGNTQPLDVPLGTDSNHDGIPDEATGHGTHVAGLVALVAPQAGILPMRVLDSDGRGNSFQIAHAIEDAALRGARVINLSLGMVTPDAVMEQALAFASSHGALLVAAIGNRHALLPSEYPASSRYCIAVAATDLLDGRADFSDYGPYAALAAPGVSIRSTFWDGGYAVWSGTSMSTPMVSGAVALLAQLHPGWGRAQMVRRLQAESVPLPAALQIGPGRLDVGAALRMDGLAKRSSP